MLDYVTVVCNNSKLRTKFVMLIVRYVRDSSCDLVVRLMFLALYYKSPSDYVDFGVGFLVCGGLCDL